MLYRYMFIYIYIYCFSDLVFISTRSQCLGASSQKTRQPPVIRRSSDLSRFGEMRKLFPKACQEEMYKNKYWQLSTSKNEFAYCEDDLPSGVEFGPIQRCQHIIIFRYC